MASVTQHPGQGAQLPATFSIPSEFPYSNAIRQQPAVAGGQYVPRSFAAHPHHLPGSGTSVLHPAAPLNDSANTTFSPLAMFTQQTLMEHASTLEQLSALKTAVGAKAQHLAEREADEVATHTARMAEICKDEEALASELETIQKTLVTLERTRGSDEEALVKQSKDIAEEMGSLEAQLIELTALERDLHTMRENFAARTEHVVQKRRLFEEDVLAGTNALNSVRHAALNVQSEAYRIADHVSLGTTVVHPGDNAHANAAAAAAGRASPTRLNMSTNAPLPAPTSPHRGNLRSASAAAAIAEAQRAETEAQQLMAAATRIRNATAQQVAASAAPPAAISTCASTPRDPVASVIAKAAADSGTDSRHISPPKTPVATPNVARPTSPGGTEMFTSQLRRPTSPPAAAAAPLPPASAAVSPAHPAAPGDGSHSFHTVVAAGHTEAALTMLRANPELVNHLNAAGETPLHVACGSEWISLELVNALLLAGSSTTVRNHLGYTAFHVACLNAADHASHALKKFLIFKASVNPNQRTARGETAAHLCATHDRHLPALQYLCQGAKLDLDITALARPMGDEASSPQKRVNALDKARLAGVPASRCRQLLESISQK